MKLQLILFLHKIGAFSLIDLIRDYLDWWKKPSDGSYSQHGEDLFVLNHFQNRPGVYLDIGASHPFRISNTYLLYRRGWRGVTVEPIPRLSRKHRHWRKRDIQLNVAAGEHAQQIEFMELVPSVLSTFSREKADQAIRHGSAILYRQYDVKVLSLTDIYRETLFPQPVDLLTIDTEGFGMSILKGLDLTVLSPRVIILEMDNDPTDDELRAYLHSNGYKTIQVLGCNELFERQSDGTR